MEAWVGSLRFLLTRLVRNENGAIAPMTALMMIPIVGAISYAVELGSWQYMQRSAQNAADSAALAAAIVNSDTGTTSEQEALSAARKFNFINGVNGVTVTSAVTTCPAEVTAGSTCHEAIISTSMPISFAGILGLSGSQEISARAVAVAAGGGAGGALTNDVCVWTLSNLQTNGTPDANLSGCSALSNGNMTCTGNGLHADYAVAGGTVSGTCSEGSENNVSGSTDLPTDPYASLASNIPANSCSSYSQNSMSGSGTGVIKYCGDVKLTSDVTLTGTGTQLVIYNGRLDLNRHTLKTAAGASATVIFTGTNGGTYQHYPVDNGIGSGSGVIEIEAPTNDGNPWKGIAVYQDPAITTGVDFTYSGNKPAWKITGVIYLPKATVTFSGIVDKADDGAQCQILVAYNATLNGTGKIIGDVSGCADAGIDPPDVTVGTATADRPKLVK